MDMNRDEEHLRLLSIFHYVVAGLGALFSLFPLIYTAMGAFFIFAAHHWPPKPGQEPPPEHGHRHFNLAAFKARLKETDGREWKIRENDQEFSTAPFFVNAGSVIVLSPAWMLLQARGERS